MKKTKTPSITYDYTLDVGLPASIEAERAILGAILLDNVTYSQASELLTSDDFSLDSHRRIYARMVDLAESSRPIDFVTLTEELRMHKEVESVGGVAYITSLTDGLPRVKNIMQYVAIAKDKALLRQLIHASSSAINSAYAQDAPAIEIISAAEDSIMQVAEQRVTSGLADIGTIVKEDFGSLDQLFQRGQRITGVETHYEEFDNMTSGLHEGELIIIAARPGAGKSSLATNILENCCIKDEKVAAIFSLEMKRGALVQRMLCSQARVDSHKFRTGFIGRDDYPKLTDALGRLVEAKIFIDDQAAIALSELRAKCKRLIQKEGKLDVVIVDYLQLMSGGKKFENRTQEVSYLSRGLKILAKELGCPVVALSQLNRLLEARGDKRPMLSDLRESGSLEQDSDVVAFIFRAEMYEKDNPDLVGLAELILAKQRAGATGTIHLTWLAQYCRFENRAMAFDATAGY